ncbi:MAG: helix-turn-helix domain-containing protein, partial [Mycobacterium sp.]
MSDTDRALLQAWVRAGTTPQKMALRASIVLMAADGTTNATIAEELGVCLDTARTWRARFCTNGVDGLADAPRSGRPPVYSAGEVARVKAWACELRATHGLPLSR